jgi:ATP-dependent DNA helicase RecQ
MEAYARTAYCRWRMLREYFGESEAEERCGRCDNCRRGLAEKAEKAKKAEGVQDSELPLSPPSPPRFTPGDKVTLPKYGDGTVQEVEGDSILVRFPGGRARKFKREFARPVPRSRQKR